MEEKKEQKKIFEKSFIKRFLQVFIVIFSLIILVLSVITIGSTIKAKNLAFLRYRFYIMSVDSKQDVAEKGDLVIAKKLDPGELKSGDYIIYGNNKIYYCDKIAEVKKRNVVNKVVTAECNGISYQLNENEISGKVIKKCSKMGSINIFLKTPLGIILFILFIVFLFALLRILISWNEKEEEK